MQTIQLKRSNVPSHQPVVADLAPGEVAINTYDGKLFFKKDDGVPTIVSISPLDDSLASISSLAGTSGLLRKTGIDTWTLDTNVYENITNRNTPSTGYVGMDHFDKYADFRGIRNVSLSFNSTLRTAQDNITVNDFRKIINYTNTGAAEAWTHVELPDLNTIGPEHYHTPITIFNTSIANASSLRVVPFGYASSTDQDTFYNTETNIFYPKGAISLYNLSSVTLLPYPPGNYWWVIDYNPVSTIRNVADIDLTLVLNVNSSGTIASRRGFLNAMVTKSGTGTYKVDWEAQVFDPRSSVLLTVRGSSGADPRTVHYQAIDNTTINVFTYQNGILTDLPFCLAVCYPTVNTNKPA